MTKKQIFFFLTLIVSLLGCHLVAKKTVAAQTADRQLPKNLNEAIAYLDADWSSREKIKFKNQSEEDAGVSLHFTTGLWIRNNWIRGDRDTDLVNYFHKIGIYTPDDISSIIITSFHRQLNHQSLDINGQIKPIKSYWKSVYDCEEKARKSALVNYDRFETGDLITISMFVDTSDHQRNAVTFECPKIDWQFNPKKDLMLTGVIEGKKLNDTANILFSIRVNKMNYPNTTIFMDTVKIGNIKTFSLKNLDIKPSIP